MVDSLLLSAFGMTAVFGCLIAMMFVMIGMERALREEAVSVSRMESAVQEAPAKMEAESESVDVESEGIITEQDVEIIGEASNGDDSFTEIAIVMGALSAYMKNHGKTLKGKTISISGLQQGCTVGYTTSGSVMRSSDSKQGKSERVVQVEGVNREQVWRSAYPLAQKGYWQRGCWGGQRRLNNKRQ